MAAAVGAAGTALPGAAQLTPPAVPLDTNAKRRLGTRAEQAFALRLNAALAQRNQSPAQQQSNGDEQRYPTLFANFCKGLVQNSICEPAPAAYAAYLRALKAGTSSALAAIPMAGSLKLVNPQAAYAFQMEGADSHALACPPAPTFASEDQAAEMVELYWHALTRDVPFSQYGQEPLTRAAIADLSRFRLWSGVDAGTVFRGEVTGAVAGPYLSQFLLQNVTMGAWSVSAQIHTCVGGDDFLTTYGDWLAIHLGGKATRTNQIDPTPRYIRNRRDLATWVHRDFSYETFLNAALTALSWGPSALSPTNPYRSSGNQAGFVTFGQFDILATVAKASQYALNAAWVQKWLVHRRIRPEEFAARIHHHSRGDVSYPFDAKLLDSAALDAIRRTYGDTMLPIAYPEGCPAHPSYPGGHAVIAGAGVTVLKAFFNEAFPVPDPKEASDDGLTLQPYTGETLTLGGELDKLAYNIGIGRDAAGMHWRSDETHGLRLGEAVAIGLLQDLRLTYTEDFAGFTLTTFDGEKVSI